MNDDHDPFRVEADYLEEDSSSVRDYASEYKREAVLLGTTAALYATANGIANADEIYDVVTHFF